MERSYLIVIRELRRVYNYRRSISKKNKVILSKLIQDIAELIAKAHVEMTTSNRGEALKKYREFKNTSNENRVGKNT